MRWGQAYLLFKHFHMTFFRLIIRTLKHHIAGNLATAGGIAIATAVICGALIIGDSISMSLVQIVDNRLGGITHTITAGERIFSQELGSKAGQHGLIETASVLKTEAVVSVQGGDMRVNQVHVWGIDSLFSQLGGTPGKPGLPGNNEIIINDILAGRLEVDTGDFVLLRMKNTGPIPVNTPFVSEADQTVSRRVRVIAILSNEEHGHFSLQASQSAPLNAYADINWLNNIMGLQRQANMVLVKAPEGFETELIYDILRKSWRAEDGSLSVNQLSDADGPFKWQITSGRVFIDAYLGEQIMTAFPEQERALTYFVNSLEYKDTYTPYSFVTAIDRHVKHAMFDETDSKENADRWQLETGQTIINQWLASDLGVAVGDSITMHYFEIGPLRDLVERKNRFLVKGILSMQEAVKDSVLMPDLPGLSDAGSCRDWDAGIPIDLDAIRQKDEDYWEIYKGTPKAYISLGQGQQIWENRFGNLTSVMITGDLRHEEVINETITKYVDPVQLGFMVRAVREQGLMAAQSGVDFGGLFAALGVFIIISGLLLTSLLLRFNLRQRHDHIRLFGSLGFSTNNIRKILMWEAFVTTLAGVLAGAIISIGYSRLIFAALNHNWYDIVRSSTLNLHIQTETLIAGLLGGLLAGLAMTFRGTQTVIKENQPQNQAVKKKAPLQKQKTMTAYAAAAIMLVALSMAAYLGMASHFDRPFAWLISGILFLTACLTGAFYVLFRHPKKTGKTVSLATVSLNNLVRNPLRSFTIIMLLALGSFVIVVTAANRKESLTDDTIATSGTGGFQFWAETTTPLINNLNQAETKRELGLPDNSRIVQFMSTFDDDASCLNLNIVANPRILATDPSHLEGRFSFVSGHPWLDMQNPWNSLNIIGQGVVPAIADQTVIQWGLGKKVGDTLVYINAHGNEVKLLLIGGLANSIFQGNVIIAASHFLHHFPDAGGSDVMLIESIGNDPDSLAEQLGMSFRDYGWNMISTIEKLAEFNSVENTYLQIFFLMGAFGMLLGTIGLAVIMAKSLLERRSETALLMSTGFRKLTIIRLLFAEYAILFLAGLLIGTFSAGLATLPNFVSANHTVSLEFLTGVLLLLAINGMAWIVLIPYTIINRMRLLSALRNE